MKKSKIAKCTNAVVRFAHFCQLISASFIKNQPYTVVYDSDCRKTFFDFMQHLRPIELFVGNGLSPRQEPPLCGGCAPKRACGRSDRSVLPCQKHDVTRKQRAIRRDFMRCARPDVRMGRDPSLYAVFLFMSRPFVLFADSDDLQRFLTRAECFCQEKLVAKRRTLCYTVLKIIAKVGII